MKIILDKIGKQFKEEWIFHDVNFEFNHEEHAVILGSNGSGKSTLLNIISTHMIPSSGGIHFFLNNQEVKPEQIFRHLAICSPYIELIEEFTLSENINFFCSFKKLKNSYSAKKVIDILNLKVANDKVIREFSSGMKQRVKLILAILSDVPLVLLDEPCSNLDAEGVNWYKNLVAEHTKNRLFIVSSNEIHQEYSFCSKELYIKNYK